MDSDAKTKIGLVEQMLTDLEQGRLAKELMNEFPDLAAKMLERDKLRYRLNILKRAATDSKRCDEEADKRTTTNGSSCGEIPAANEKCSYVQVEDFGDSIIERLNNVFFNAVRKAYPSLEMDNISVKETTNPKFGDYQFDLCMQIARRIGAKSNVKVPMGDVVKEIVGKLEHIPLVEKYVPVNAYINVYINKHHLCKRLAEIFAKGLKIPKIAKKHIIVDFSSPNIAKQMHVGHLRSTIIGESISRLLEYVGFSVLRLNHIGDWGTQFGMLIAHLKNCFPNYLNETPPIQDLQAFYKESKVKFDEDFDFKAEAYKCVVQLQNLEPDIVKAWKMICDASRKDFAEIYKRLDIDVVERGESFYQTRMQSTIQELEQTGVLKEDDGRKLFFPHGCTIPLTIVKSDGGFTYDTSDITAIKQRLFEEKADWILYVVDRGQAEHLETVFAAARQLKWYNSREKRVEHVQFGLVLGEDRKKFKTRSGDNVKLMDLLDEGVRRSEEKLRLKGKDKEFTPEQFKQVAEAVAYGCIRYADMAQSRTGDYVFSFDRMLDDRGNTAVYLLYAYARIRSISRNAQITREQIDEYIKGLPDGTVPLDHPREIRLVKQIMKFSDTLLAVLGSLQVNKICDYVYELATVFHDFYKDCYVVNKLTPEDGGQTVTKINFNRLVLCEVTADIMQRCFHILGIRALDRM